MDRISEAKDRAAVLWLCSSEASFILGQIRKRIICNKFASALFKFTLIVYNNN
jgi:hypothetical protein